MPRTARQIMAHVMALLAAAGAAAAIFTGVGGELRLYPAAFLLILIVGLVFGMPVYAVLLAARRVQWKSAIIAGFVVGAALPLFVVMTFHASQASVGGVATVVNGAYTWAGWRQNAMVVGGFGLLGTVGALVFWFLLKTTGAIPAAASEKGDHDRTPPWRVVMLAFAAVGFTAASIAVPEITRDRSCHNPLRDGRDSLGSVASFDLYVGPSDWDEAAAIIGRFAHQRKWSIRSDVRPDESFKWFQISLCTEPGTQILVGALSDGNMHFSLSQPQGGESWREPLAALLARVQGRWPDKIGFTGNQGENISRPGWAVEPAERKRATP